MTEETKQTQQQPPTRILLIQNVKCTCDSGPSTFNCFASRSIDSHRLNPMETINSLWHTAHIWLLMLLLLLWWWLGFQFIQFDLTFFRRLSIFRFFPYLVDCRALFFMDSHRAFCLHICRSNYRKGTKVPFFKQFHYFLFLLWTCPIHITIKLCTNWTNFQFFPFHTHTHTCDVYTFVCTQIFTVCFFLVIRFDFIQWDEAHAHKQQNY